MTTNFWNQTRACAHSVFTAQLRVNTTLSLLPLEKYPTKKMCLMRDWPDICGARFLLDVSLPFISLRSCTLVLTSTLLFIAGPSEPPSLIIFIIIAYVPSDPSPPFQLAAAGEESQEKREKKGAGTKLRRCPRLFCRFFFFFARSCQSLQLRGAEELVQTAEELLCSCQSCSLMLLARGNGCRGRGQQSSACRPTSRFK